MAADPAVATEPLEFASAKHLRQLLELREISAVELLEHYLARVEALNPTYNAIVALDVDGARRRAKEADEATSRRESFGPLHGLPITIKDAFAVKGMPATCGLAALRDYRPMEDAAAVASLRRAGAVIFGKTNLPAGATDHQSYNSLFGVTRNPWNPERTVGGSSGGSAAALTAGLTTLELGSDIGGSIRVPAHFCGVYGHKPSYGIVPGKGHIPPPPGDDTTTELGVFGPLARSPYDLETALDIIIAPAELEAGTLAITLPPPRHQDLRAFRVALWNDGAAYPLDDRCRAAIDAYAADLRSLGVSVREGRPEMDPRESYDIYLRTLFGIIGGGVDEATLAAFAAAAAGAPAGSYPERLGRAVRQSLREWMATSKAREDLFRRWRAFFRDYDVLLCPIAPTIAFPHDNADEAITAQFGRRLSVNGKPIPYMDGLAWPGVATVANLPATAIPTGRLVDGLPVGLQVIGPYLEDRTPLRFAQLAADALGGFKVPPSLGAR